MKITEGFRLRQVMGETVITGEGIKQINFNKLIVLNASAAYLWQSIEGKEFSVNDLAELLTGHYGIDPTIAQKDASIIAREWIHNGIIQE